jgi:uncharacterized integral membrane protein
MPRNNKEHAADVVVGRTFAATILIAFAALALFAVQNRQSVQIHFLWYDGTTRVCYALMFAAVMGVVLGVVLGFAGTILFRWWRERAH